MLIIFRKLIWLALCIPVLLLAQEDEYTEEDAPLPPLSFGVDFPVTEWGQFGRVSSHLGKNFVFDSQLPFSKVWSKRISYSKRGETYANSVSGDGLLYVLDSKGVITAFDLYDGAVAWSNALREKDYSNVGGGLVLGDLLYAVDGDGMIYAIEPLSGEIFWWKSLESPVSVPPLWYEGRLYLVTQENTVYSVNSSDGTVIWSYSGVPQNRVLMNHGAPAMGKRIVIVPFSSGEIKALSLFDGREIWSRSMLLNKGGNPNLLPAVSSPVVDLKNKQVFYTSQAYEVAALNLLNGEVLWKLDDASSVYMPMIVEENVLVVTRDERLLVVNASDGEVLWNLKLPFQSPNSGEGFLFFRKSKQILVWHVPIVAGGKICLVSHKGHLVVYDGDNGDILSIQNLIDENSNERIATPPIWVDGTLYVVSDSGRVSAWR